ncbi:MAG: hypothetical protein HC893_11185 [Chloroflexaceae bacterium]|nr:hypothetical protein [Chloroflexaceae bacterium]NJL34314.1 hypothetical protein [Chloroflexaceae bacterium]NJO05979.1 hypothetical protein [Chloroflexaceae bacterium]
MSKTELTLYVLVALLACSVAITMPLDAVVRMLLVVFGLLTFKHAVTEQ